MRFSVRLWLVVFAGSCAVGQGNPAVTSKLQIIEIDGGRTATVYTTHGHFEAPNWTRDGASLVFDQDGKILRIPVRGGTPSAVDTGNATQCNGSHGLSPDGKLLAISCSTPELPGSRVYLVPLAGGTPKLATQRQGSYWHSWSPDGRTLLFTHPDHGSLNIYSIAIDGSSETALTSSAGVSDDPDFSPDGRYIYFNSDRSGTMQIWRMHPDGSAAEQLTFDERANWTPHPSPDGRWVVFVSYEKGVTGHPANKPIELRLMSVADKSVRVLTTLVGGAGTINVPSWSPDSRRLAFVSYEVAAEK